MQDKDVKELGMKFRYALNLKDLLEYSRRGGGVFRQVSQTIWQPSIPIYILGRTAINNILMCFLLLLISHLFFSY